VAVAVTVTVAIKCHAIKTKVNKQLRASRNRLWTPQGNQPKLFVVLLLHSPIHILPFDSVNHIHNHVFDFAIDNAT